MPGFETIFFIIYLTIKSSLLTETALNNKNYNNEYNNNIELLINI